MFAEDPGQIESHLFTRIIDELIANPERSSADDVGQLFEWLNRDGPRPAGGLYATTRYVNGALFQHPARVHLDLDELRVLQNACDYDWRRVEPHIFGSLLEGALGRESQWALGAHYTHDIQDAISKRCSIRSWPDQHGQVVVHGHPSHCIANGMPLSASATSCFRARSPIRIKTI
jgi:hypothetical protein